jgi:glutaminase
MQHDPTAIAPGSVTLAEHQLCTGLAADMLARLEAVLELRHYTPGELIIRIGDRGAEVFLLMRGLVSVTLDLPHGQRTRLSTISPGMTFGELALVDQSPRTADVRADSPAECLVLSAAALERLGEAEPRIKTGILVNLLRSVYGIVARRNREVTTLTR